MRRVFDQIADGFRDEPLPGPQAIRACLRWLIPMAALHLLLGAFALMGESALFASGMLVAAVQPLSALLIFMAGLQLNRGMKPHGALMMAAAGLYVFVALLPVLVGANEPLVFCFFVAAFLGPIVGLTVFGLLAGAIWISSPEDQPAHIAWAIGLAFPVALVLSLLTLLLASQPDPWLIAWVFAPQAATALACFLAYRHMRIPQAELDLVRAVEREEFQDFYLIEHTFPAGVATSIALPFTPFERAKGGGTPLGNPVLDELLPIYTTAPQQLAKTLGGNEATVLAVLHAWPMAQLRNNTLSWEASMAQIQEKGLDPAQTLAQVQADLRSFQALFQEESADVQGFQPKG